MLTVSPEETVNRLITTAKTKYTLREALLLKQLSDQATKKSLKYWVAIEKRGELPCRTGQSMFTWSKANAKLTLDEIMRNLEEKGTYYCFSFVTPVRPHEPLPEKKPKTPRYERKSSPARHHREDFEEEEKFGADLGHFEHEENMPPDIFYNEDEGAKSEDDPEKSAQPPKEPTSEHASAAEPSPESEPRKRKREEEAKRKGGRKRVRKEVSAEEEVPLERPLKPATKKQRATREPPKEIRFFEEADPEEEEEHEEEEDL